MMAVLDDGKRRLSYQDEGAGAAVVLIHGVGANLRSWDKVAERLSERFRVVRADLRGHGDSARITEPFSLEGFAEDTVALLEHLGLARAHIVGFSLGGLIAQCLAVGWPERVERLALLSAVAGRTPEERAKVTGRLALIKRDGIAAVTVAARERWFTEAFATAYPERISARIAELVANDKASYLEAYRVFGESEMGPRLKEIRHRTLVLTGEHDVGSTPRMARFMHEQIADSELVILPGLKHSLLTEVPELVAERIEAFLVD